MSLLFWCITISAVPSKSLRCGEEYSCALQTIYEGPEKIECTGYHGCTQAESIESANGNSIYCTASYACYEANSIRYTNTTIARDIYCHGLFGCAFVPLIQNVNGKIDCTGELSCFGSKMEIHHETNCILYCDGDRSCANSLVNNANIVYIRGHMAASQATFRSLISSNYSDLNTSLSDYDNRTEQYYYFSGRDSGNGATIICEDGNTCFVFCDENACNNLSLTCHGNCSFMYVMFICQFDVLIRFIWKIVLLVVAFC